MRTIDGWRVPKGHGASYKHEDHSIFVTAFGILRRGQSARELHVRADKIGEGGRMPTGERVPPAIYNTCARELRSGAYVPVS